MTDRSEKKHANRLVHETSPYLLQHAHNPVDWHPWGEEALRRARVEDRPILLSIGYSACHWCHVMERESFENEEVARIMNENFVCVKVDREERPDLDDIYMAATVAFNRGQGGWPMTVFLAPDQKPFFAGTYFPPEDRYGRPGFGRLMLTIADLWKNDRDDLLKQGEGLAEHLRRQSVARAAGTVGGRAIEEAAGQLGSEFDPVNGGFGPAPKFPPATALSLLLRHHRRTGDARSLEMVRRTLDGMARGGIYDQVGGGFARYSTDDRWLVPHFEKMLYDNALLARIYLEGHQSTRDPFYGRIAAETLDYILREMTSPEGGFYSATDADSEGEEGKFFVWTPDEIRAVLDGEAAGWFCAYYDITPAGNWEGKSIPNMPYPLEEAARRFELDPEEFSASLRESKKILYEARRLRVPPGLDDKILTSWNGLMIGAMAEGHRVLGDERYLAAAARAADFILTRMARPDGGLFRTSRDGKVHIEAYLEDYAYLAEALIDLYEAGGPARFLSEAARLAERMRADFSEEEAGAFYNTAKGHERLLFRFREGHDGAIPNANAAAATALARLSFHFDKADGRAAAAAAIEAYGRVIAQAPRAFAKSLLLADFLLEGPVELALVGTPGDERFEALRREMNRVHLPNRIIGHADPAAPEGGALPLLEGKGLVDGRAALYVCRNFTCGAPITDPALVASALESERKSAASGRKESL